MSDVESILSSSRFENVQYVPGEWYKPESRLPGGHVSFLDGQALRSRARRRSRRDDDKRVATSAMSLMAASNGPESPVSRDKTHASSYSETSEACSGDSTLPKRRSSFEALLKRLVEGFIRSAAIIRHAPNKRIRPVMIEVAQRASLNSPERWRLDSHPPERSKSTPEHVVARRGTVPSFTSMASNGVVPDLVPPPRP